MSRAANTSSKKRKPVSRSGSKGKRKKPVNKGTPRWVIYLSGVGVAVFFSLLFYLFYIRPYAYRYKPCYGFKEYDVCMPFGYNVHGVDISRYQGNIDWPLLELTRQKQRYPIRFVFAKATEGGDLMDRTFSYNFESARKSGFIRGAYHYYIPSTPPEKQADFYIERVKLRKGDLPPVLDIEVTGKRNIDDLRRDLKVWLDRVEAHYGVKPIIYTSFNFKTRYLNDSLFNSYPYWIAHYYVDTVTYKGHWEFWQHTDVGVVPGIPEKVDLNIFNGSMEELKKLTI